MQCPRCKKEHELITPCRLIDLTRANISVDLADVPLVFLDVETTGFSPLRGDRIVEISMVKMRNGETIGAYDTLIDPQRPIPSAATAVHGIDIFAVMNREPFAHHLDEIAWFLNDQCVVVGHKIKFDLEFLNSEIARAGRASEQWQGLSFCTLLLAQNVYKFSDNKLASLAMKLGIEVESSHRAGKDVQTTISVFDLICERIRPKEAPLTVRHVLQAQGRYMPAPLAGDPAPVRTKGGPYR